MTGTVAVSIMQYKWWIILAIILLIGYKLYFDLVTKKNKVKEAFSGIDVQLKKRYDLIPNVLTIADKFMEHERELMQEITRLRSSATKLSDDFNNVPDKIKLGNEIAGKMSQLLVAVENYPQLKSDTMMNQAIQTYNETEEHIAAARRFYNSATLELNNAVEIFPSSLVAALINIKQMPFFEIEDEKQREPINAADYLKK